MHAGAGAQEAIVRRHLFAFPDGTLAPVQAPTRVRVLALDARVKDGGGVLVQVKLEERPRLALHREWWRHSVRCRSDGLGSA